MLQTFGLAGLRTPYLRAFLGVALLLAPAQRCRAANPKSLTVHRTAASGAVTFVEGVNGQAIPMDGSIVGAVGKPTDLFRRYGELFGITNVDTQLVQRAVRRDALRQIHTTFQQVQAGVPVFSGVLKIHQDDAGRFLAVNGRFYPVSPSLPTIPTLTAKEATDRILAALEVVDPAIERNELVIVDPGWYGDPSIGAHLAYHVVVHDAPVALHEAFFVDAHTGKTLDRWSLDESVRRRMIYDGQLTVDLPGTPARAEGDLPVGKPADVDRAYDYSGDYYDYFFRAYGWDSFDGQGTPITVTVNSIAGGCPNALWTPRLKQAIFCPGTLGDDIVAHELTHALTDSTADLIYQNQPGQLNESFSDVFGELIDLYNGDTSSLDDPQGPSWPTHGTGPGTDEPGPMRTPGLCNFPPAYPDGLRWMAGEDATVFGGAIRDMWEPNCWGMPDRANSPLQLCKEFDNGGVHVGSSIANHAFAMLVDGKAFNGSNVTGIGPIKAGAVWFRALTTYLSPASNFEDAYIAFNRSAADLVGTYPNDPRTGLPHQDAFTAFDAQQVELATRAAELNTPGRCGTIHPILDPAPGPVCGDRRTIFRDGFESDASMWTAHNSAPWTPYDWRTVGDLPFDREGMAMFCPDAELGDCRTTDESATHELDSPIILLPAGVTHPMLTFVHYVVTEPGTDGANVWLSVNGGRWRIVPSSAFLFNPYNSTILPSVAYNTNPLAGTEGWSGAGGKWGFSVIDLSTVARGGDAIRVRFALSKDLCDGIGGWYVDDFEVFDCPDCNLNGLPDSADRLFTHTFDRTGNIGENIGENIPATLTLLRPPVAASDVLLKFSAIGDFGAHSEKLLIDLNGAPVGQTLSVGARDCPMVADQATLTVPAEIFNAAVAGDDAVFHLVPTRDVSPTLCGGTTYVRMAVEYHVSTVDADDNAIPDQCEDCAPPPAPTVLDGSVPSNRYLSIAPNGFAGRKTALRVVVSLVPRGFESSVGKVYWVNEPLPKNVSKSPALSDERYARLSCEPVFFDWSTTDIVHVADREILPGGMYTVQSLDLACYFVDGVDGIFRVSADDYSGPVAVRTASRWGDMIGNGPSAPPNGTVNALDLAAAVDAFKELPSALGVIGADLDPSVPDLRLTILDVASVVDAIFGRPLPFAGPRNCK